MLTWIKVADNISVSVHHYCLCCKSLAQFFLVDFCFELMHRGIIASHSIQRVKKPHSLISNYFDTSVLNTLRSRVAIITCVPYCICIIQEFRMEPCNFQVWLNNVDLSVKTQTNMMECFLKVKGEDTVAEEGGDRLPFRQREVGTWINMRKMALFLTRTINKKIKTRTYEHSQHWQIDKCLY